MSRDALDVIARFDSEDALHYIDPPYFNSDCGHYKGYSETDFKALLDMISKIKGKFLLSSYPSDILDEYIAENGWCVMQKEQPLAVVNKHKKYSNTKIEQMTVNYRLEDEGLFGAE